MRVFLALPVDSSWAQSASGLVARLRSASPPASWTRPESWHVTLQFLGEIEPEHANRFADALDRAASGLAGGSLSSAGSLFLPAASRPRVLGVGFSSSSPAYGVTRELAAAAENAAHRLGVAPENRPFRPHVTLARLRQPWPHAAVEACRSALDGWAFPDWSVRACVLYQSRLSPSGAVHTPIREWSLAPPRRESESEVRA